MLKTDEVTQAGKFKQHLTIDFQLLQKLIQIKLTLQDRLVQT